MVCDIASGGCSEMSVLLVGLLVCRGYLAGEEELLKVSNVARLCCCIILDRLSGVTGARLGQRRQLLGYLLLLLPSKTTTTTTITTTDSTITTNNS